MEPDDTIIEAGIGALLKTKYFIIQEVIDEAEERHSKAVNGLAAPKAKEEKAKHEIELLKIRIEKAKARLDSKRKELGEVKDDLGEAKTEIEENKDAQKEFQEAETVRTDKLEDVEDKCKDAKEELFEVNRKFNEATRSLSMKEFDLEAAQNRVNTALKRIAEVEDIKTSSSQQTIHVEKRGGKSTARKIEKENKIEALAKQIEDIDDVTEVALQNIAKFELKREYQIDQIEYWELKTERVAEEINSANQEDGGAF